VLVAFRRLVRLVPRNGLLLIGADSPHAKALVPTAVSPVETFGLDELATWRASAIDHRDGLTRFDVLREGKPFGRFESPLLGVHNVRNALAAIAVGTRVGIPPETLAEGLRQFKGIKRRLETVGVAKGVTVLDDFAHHPTAVHETLSALRTGYPGRRLWAVFEPRSASSCRRVFQADFAKAFGAADEVVLAAVFRSSLPEAERLSAEQLVDDVSRQGRHARHIPEIDDIVSTIVRERRDGDVVVLMSNGGFGGIHGKLLQALRE
jgi:UDP-N-acetylmuramate: L-alanyl-gamma-D-glutamyl-meso-diaminopimelate ligase